jgi:hypothetical protein
METNEKNKIEGQKELIEAAEKYIKMLTVGYMRTCPVEFIMLKTDFEIALEKINSK